MNDGARIDVIDVGHGSSVAVHADGATLLIDVGPGGALLEYLRTEQIRAIDTILISHADADHIGGLSAILAQRIPIGRIIWNGDSLKDTALWTDLIYQLHDLDSAGIVAAQENAYAGQEIALGASVKVLVLAPNLILRKLGAGSTDRDGRRITSNTVSVVAQVMIGGEPLMIVPGDLDAVGFHHLRKAYPGDQMQSRYLVLPHHGGHVGVNDTATAGVVSALVAAVGPEMVFVSNGRSRFNNPRRVVIDAVKTAAPNSSIRCTQLSKDCAVTELLQTRVPPAYSVGWARGHSCAGTTSISASNGIDDPLDTHDHQDFLHVSVPGRMC